MALINCPECGKEISDQIKKCPNCGYPIKKRKIRQVIILGVSLAIILISMVIVYAQIIKPNKIYNEAVLLYKQEKYDEAEFLFNKISGFKDTLDYLNLIKDEDKYEEAVSLFDQEKYEEAALIFNEIPEYKDTSNYVDLIGKEKIYQQAQILVDQGEYTAANELYSDIQDYKDVKDIQTKMKDDIAYNDYIDNALKFAFCAESTVILADDLLDDITSIWYNSIYEKDSYSTDEYTKNAQGEFYDDFNMALMIYFMSDDYEWAEEKIKENRELADKYYLKLKNVPENLKDYAQKVSAVQSTYNTMVEFALNPDGSYTSVSEGMNVKRESFDTAYNNFKMATPEKKTINASASKDRKYDFRHANFGMTMDEVTSSEMDNYALTATDSFSFGSFNSIDYDNVTIVDDIEVNITYEFDISRMLNSIWIDFNKGTTEEQVFDILDSLYGSDFVDHKYINGYNDFPAMIVQVDVDDDDTTLYINPVSSDDFNEFVKEIGQEGDVQTEMQTEEQTETQEIALDEKEENVADSLTDVDN